MSFSVQSCRMGFRFQQRESPEWYMVPNLVFPIETRPHLMWRWQRQICRWAITKVDFFKYLTLAWIFWITWMHVKLWNTLDKYILTHRLKIIYFTNIFAQFIHAMTRVRQDNYPLEVILYNFTQRKYSKCCQKKCHSSILAQYTALPTMKFEIPWKGN